MEELWSWGREDVVQSREVVAVVIWTVPHSHVVDKNWEGYLGVSDPSPRPDCTAQGSRARKIKSHNF